MGVSVYASVKTSYVVSEIMCIESYQVYVCFCVSVNRFTDISVRIVCVREL